MTRRQRSTYPHDLRDPRLKRCKECSDRWMPEAFCPKHTHRCLTCCNRLQLQCGVRAMADELAKLAGTTEDLGRSMTTAAEAAKAYTAAQVKADIDALYGKDGER